MYRSRAWILAVAAFAVGCSSKTDTASPAAVDGGDGGPPSTWTEVYTQIVAPKCVTCHNPTGVGVSAGHLDMSSQSVAYANLVGVTAAGTACSGKGTRVTPGKPDSSIFYLKISLDDLTPCGGKMPLGGPPLTQPEVDTISSWITAGAMND